MLALLVVPQCRLPPRGSVTLALLLAALCQAGCSPEVPAPSGEQPSACSSDADCPQGKLCSAGSCVVPQGPLPSECTTGDDCLPEPAIGIENLFWDGDEEVCTLDPGGCDGGSCAARRVCLAPADAATRPGEVRCSSEEQCRSGRCVEHDGDRVCLKTCAGDGDCVGELDGDGVLVGDRCALVDVAGASLLACVPVEAGRTLCRNDCDCTDDDACGDLDPSAPHCRFHPGSPLVPRCEVPPAGALLPPMAECGDPTACDGGGCLDACSGGPSAGAKNFCTEAQNRCARPCSGDTDCEERTQCLEGPPRMRVGSWLLPGQIPTTAGRDIRYCHLPIFGCFDELDCYPYDDGDLHVVSWGVESPRCRVRILRPTTTPRLLTLCETVDPDLLPPGQCCGGHDECDSGICAPAKAADGCPAGICTVPCDPVPDPDGIPGSGDETDRCAMLSAPLASLPAWLDHTHCEELEYVRDLVGDDGVSRPFSTTLRACR